MARARPANAPTDFQLIALARALLFSSQEKKRVYSRIAELVSLRLNSTELALLSAKKLCVSEPTARRAVQKLKQLGLVSSKNGYPVFLTPLGENFFRGV